MQYIFSGYGNLYPVTTNGKVATMVSTFFGFPLVLTILSDWGNLLFSIFAKVYQFLSGFSTARQKRRRMAPKLDANQEDEPSD